MVHVRCKFYDESKQSGAAIAKEAVKRIGTRYDIEIDKEAKGKSPQERAYLSNRQPELDNNICERALKMAISHRKNSLFYKTENGGEEWIRTRDSVLTKEVLFSSFGWW